MKKIIFNITLIVSLLLLQSCLKEEENIFGKSSAERLIEMQLEYEKLLSSPENGWVMDYYAGFEDGRLGGYQIMCKFNEGRATMAGAFTMGKYEKVGEVIESSYTISRMQGPCLSFNTYNTVLHPFADPGSISDPYGYGGDFEFVIMKATKEEIIMQGIKQKQVIVMRPMEVNKDWNEYCAEVVELKETLANYTRFSVEKAGQHEGFMTLWAGDNEIHDTDRPDIQISKYAVTNVGINLYDSLCVNNNTIKRLVWDKTNSKFVDMDKSTNVELVPTFIQYKQLIGKYMVTTDNFEDPVEVEFKEKGDGKTIRVSSDFLRKFDEDLDYEFDIEVYENNALGIKTQILDKDPETGYVTKLAVATRTNILWTASAGYNATRPYSGSWYRYSQEKPELRFLQTSFTGLFFPTYIVGIRVVVFKNETSLSSSDVISNKTVVISNPIFVKQ